MLASFGLKQKFNAFMSELTVHIILHCCVAEGAGFLLIFVLKAACGLQQCVTRPAFEGRRRGTFGDSWLVALLGTARQVWRLPSRAAAVPSPRALGNALLEGWLVATTWAPS